MHKDPTAIPVFAGKDRVRIRKDLRNLSDLEINDLRNAYEALYAITSPADKRGYQYIAGVHGIPGQYCHKDEHNFWPWHRAYMDEFEQSLRDAQTRSTHKAPTVTLPYWDWTVLDPKKDAPNGIPIVCNDPEYTDLHTGVKKPNPLFSAFSSAIGKQTSRRTTRLAGYIPTLKAGVETCLGTSDFLTASTSLNNGPHGAVHVLVGGDMGVINTAAFDPIFYFHHGNIDRIWWQWQAKWGNATVPAAQLAFVTAPWTYLGSQTLNAESFFGYTYRAFALHRGRELVQNAFTAMRAVPLAAQADVASVAAFVATPPPPPSALRLELGDASGVAEHGSLTFQNMAKTKDSYEVRVFVNADAPTAATPTTGNPQYAGTLWLFGHGECVGDLGHCDRPSPEKRAFDHREPHHLTPYDLKMDVSSALRAALASPPAGNAHSVSLVVLDAEGNATTAPDLDFDGVSLEAT